MVQGIGRKDAAPQRFPASDWVSKRPDLAKFPVKFLVCREFCPETGAISTASPARQSCVQPGSRIDARIGRKSWLFANSPLSPDSRSCEVEGEITESLRPNPQKFPFCGDYRRRLVRSALPPEGGSPNSATTRALAPDKVGAGVLRRGSSMTRI